jgi:UDP-galactopyranose mutase
MYKEKVIAACDYLVVGCGLSGAVIAERIATTLGKKVVVIDKRDHVAGNCYDHTDQDTGIRVSKYGPHFFHTNDEGVWDYVNRFAEWRRWDHKVASCVGGKFIPLPVNINTINAMFDDAHLRTEEDMVAWLEAHKERLTEVKTSEDVCLTRFGKEIYETLFKPYTMKQWGKSPEELDPLVLSRIPLRFDYDDRYFSDKYQVLPSRGYTDFVLGMLVSRNIHVLLNTDFFDVQNSLKPHTKVIFTGRIDAYFADSGLPPLEYRSLNFNAETHRDTNYYQPFGVVNYPEPDVPFTRITEYKHMDHVSGSKRSPHTIIVKETSCDSGEPYYPVPNAENLALYERYKRLADGQTRVRFLGRLATYRYFNMDQAIRAALDAFEEVAAEEAP